MLSQGFDVLDLRQKRQRTTINTGNIINSTSNYFFYFNLIKTHLHVIRFAAQQCRYVDDTDSRRDARSGSSYAIFGYPQPRPKPCELHYGGREKRDAPFHCSATFKSRAMC